MICSGLRRGCGGGGGGVSQVTPSHSVLDLAMLIRRPRRQFHIGYRAENTLLQLLPIWQSLSRHLNYISLCGVAANGVTGVTGQSYFLPYIFAQANLVKEICQNSKLLLKYF